jgi:hypothetical protein
MVIVLGTVYFLLFVFHLLAELFFALCFTLYATPATTAVFKFGAGIPCMCRYAFHFA